LRASLADLGRRVGARVYYPRPALCTDNGAMIAYAGWCRRTGAEAGLPRIVAKPRWPLDELTPPKDIRTTVDKIFLRELRVETIIGFWDWERRIKQIVSIDLEIGTNARVAASSDAIAGTLNYEQLAKRLIEFVGESQFQMVEALATAIGQIVIREFAAPWVKVSVAKPGAIPAAREVGIVIERTPADYA
jgi:dihydroneopterin aldolase